VGGRERESKRGCWKNKWGRRVSLLVCITVTKSNGSLGVQMWSSYLSSTVNISLLQPQKNEQLCGSRNEDGTEAFHWTRASAAERR